MDVARTIKTLIALAALATLVTSPVSAADPTSVPSAMVIAPLSVDQVVDNLVRKNQERAKALLLSEATRVYHLAYRGFPGDREAEMTVVATFDSPANKSFKVVSQSGSKLIQDRVFKKLLESEKEAGDPAVNQRTQLTRDNYDFELVAYEASEKGSQYVLSVTPKSKSKYVYRGRCGWTEPTSRSRALKPNPHRIHLSGQKRVKLSTSM